MAATVDLWSFPATRRMTPDQVVDAASQLAIASDGLSVEELRGKVKARVEELLRDEMHDACESWNAWYREHGHPFAAYLR